MYLAMLFVFLMQETLDLSFFVGNTNDLFLYANIILTALGPIILIGVGFTLGKYIIRFVQQLFSSF